MVHIIKLSPEMTVGIDIGTTAVTTVVAKRESDGKIRLLGAGSAPMSGLRSGGIVEIAAVSEALARSVELAPRRPHDVRLA